MHALGDLEIGKALVEQPDDLPSVRERLQLAERAEVAQEPSELVTRAEREERVGEVVETGSVLDVMSRRLGWNRAHISMLACYYATMEPFTVIPAIDVLDGRCVRLSEGRRERVTIEGGDPEAAASRYAAEGASWLHLVDLDGAFSGRPTPGLVEQVAAAGIPVQVGGGLRDAESIQAALDAGAVRVIVGTAASSEGSGSSLTFLAERFSEQLVVAVDARDGRVVTEGWLAESGVAPRELALRCADSEVRRLLVTGTRRDGSLAGPDTDLLAEVLTAGLPVLAAGGIASLEDLAALRDLGCEGAVVGSALWSGRFALAEALDFLA
jgi:phosphoribosylformimino-5-aminoimidazole carboxamide ribotide isomerase